MPGRAMKGYVLVPAADVADDAKIAAWVERGLATAAAMPAKIVQGGSAGGRGGATRRRPRYLILLATSVAIAGSDVSITIT